MNENIDENQNESAGATSVDPGTEVVRSVSLDLIRSEEQDRHVYRQDKLEALAANMAAAGQAEPVLLRPHPDPELRAQNLKLVVFGERRVRAARLAGWTSIRAIERLLDDREAARLQWGENQAREDLNPIEEALAIARRCRVEAWESDKEAAEGLGIAENTLRDRLKLLRLIPDIQEMIAFDQMAQSYGLAMARLTPANQWRAFQYYRGMRHPSLSGFKEFCRALAVEQDQVRLPDRALVEYMEGTTETTVAPASSPPTFPGHPTLPPMPRAQSAGLMLALYADLLAAAPEPDRQQAALVVGHVYNELRLASKIKTK